MTNDGRRWNFEGFRSDSRKNHGQPMTKLTRIRVLVRGLYKYTYMSIYTFQRINY